MNELNIQSILNILPHRFPFMLVDRVISLELDKSIVAIKNVTFNEQFFQGHFPEKAVMPGVLIVEALAQTGGILAYKSINWQSDDSLFYLGAVSEVRFKRIVIPGDQLTLSVQVLKRRSNVWKFACEALVGNESACTAEITCMEGAL